MIVRTIAAACAAVLAVMTGSATGAQRDARKVVAYPTKPVRLIVPFAPGGGTDIVARAVARKLTEAWGQQVVVDNRGGGGTIIGTELAAKSPLDGYTLLLGSTSLGINPSLRAKLPYDTLTDLVPVTQTAFQAYILVVHPGVAARDVKEFIALARAKPGTLNFGSPGLGSGTHLATELFKMLSATNLVHVPYKGSGPALTDLLGGQIQFQFGTILSTLLHVKTGRLRPLGVSSVKRSSALPDVPTIAEAGVTGYSATSWNGVLTPAGVPQPVLRKLNADVVKVLRGAEVRKRLAGDGAEPVGNSAGEFGALIRSEIAKWAKVIKAAGLRAE
ncbi:MAG: tripartite tricarboxylate transporter substrate binding protein [Betaproteobacteria bacterium]|nr:tripartite tricarboxylate transporter substrate binding protein [Betaproteobacteria bacterium]